jgi:prepilin-type N-terminal cleavage/methylation domain-containing protein/prepilin-type processing-associated H-X9-DG protein
MKTDRTGFTLVELLVVIAIVGVLIALLLPAVQSAREAARRVACASNMRQLALGVQQYHVAQRAFPPANYTFSEGLCELDQGWRSGELPNTGANWSILILPYLEQKQLYSLYDFDQPTESEANRIVRESSVSVFSCPSDQDTNSLAIPATGPAGLSGAKISFKPGSYRAVAGRSDGLNFLDSADFNNYPSEWRGAMHTVGIRGLEVQRIRDITDGTSQTLLLGESTTRTQPQQRTFWAYSYAYFSVSSVVAQGRTLWGDYERCKSAGGTGHSKPCKRGWGSMHGDGLHFAFCDGSVRYQSLSIDPEILAQMATIAGGELIGDRD